MGPHLSLCPHYTDPNILCTADIINLACQWFVELCANCAIQAHIACETRGKRECDVLWAGVCQWNHCRTVVRVVVIRTGDSQETHRPTQELSAERFRTAGIIVAQKRGSLSWRAYNSRRGLERFPKRIKAYTFIIIIFFHTKTGKQIVRIKSGEKDKKKPNKVASSYSFIL